MSFFQWEERGLSALRLPVPSRGVLAPVAAARRRAREGVAFA